MDSNYLNSLVLKLNRLSRTLNQVSQYSSSSSPDPNDQSPLLQRTSSVTLLVSTSPESRSVYSSHHDSLNEPSKTIQRKNSPLTNMKGYSVERAPYLRPLEIQEIPLISAQSLADLEIQGIKKIPNDPSVTHGNPLKSAVSSILRLVGIGSASTTPVLVTHTWANWVLTSHVTQLWWKTFMYAYLPIFTVLTLTMGLQLLRLYVQARGFRSAINDANQAVADSDTNHSTNQEQTGQRMRSFRNGAMAAISQQGKWQEYRQVAYVSAVQFLKGFFVTFLLAALINSFQFMVLFFRAHFSDTFLNSVGHLFTALILGSSAFNSTSDLLKFIANEWRELCSSVFY